MKKYLVIAVAAWVTSTICAQDNYRRSASAGSDIYTNYELRGLDNPGDPGSVPAGEGQWILLGAILTTLAVAVGVSRIFKN